MAHGDVQVTYMAWICGACGHGQKFRANVWDCLGCDDCFWVAGHCKACSQGKTDHELYAAANAIGWDLGEPSDPDRVEDPFKLLTELSQ